MKAVHDKAVRDRIPEIIQAAGKECAFEQVSEEVFLKLLQNKLKEEVAEYLAEPSLEELADIQEVLLAIVRLSGYSQEDLEAVRKEKAQRRGGFEKRLLLKYVLE